MTEATYCRDCYESGVETVMVDDDGCGDLCPICDSHPEWDCGDEFPCSGLDGKPCVLNGVSTTPGKSGEVES